VLSYPLAFFIAKVAKPHNVPTLFAILLIPLWSAKSCAPFAWFIVLSYHGPLNAILEGIGIFSGPVRWITGFNGVMIGLVYTYVLFMLFPIYNAIQALDSHQIEAAEDLGAPAWKIHWRIVIPHSKPGIASGCVMVFMLSPARSSYPACSPRPARAGSPKSSSNGCSNRRTGTLVLPTPSCCLSFAPASSP